MFLIIIRPLLFFEELSGNITFCCNKMGILSVNLNNMNLDNNLDECDPDTWHRKFIKK